MTDAVDGYAAALLEIAAADGEPGQVGDDLFRIARTFESSPELREALTDPLLPGPRKVAIVSDLIGERVSDLSLRLVNFVVGMDRARDLPAIADRMVALHAAGRDRAVAEVRTAIDLDDETIRRLETALSRATGKRVEVKAVVDPAVIGGVVARIGETVIDGTVRSRLDSIRNTLEAAARG